MDLQGLVGTTAARDREKGFQQVMKQNPDIKIVANQPADFDQEKALNVTTNILQANKDIDAIFGANDDNTIGADPGHRRSEPLQAAETATSISTSSVSTARRRRLQAIRNGKQTATVSQNPIKMAEKAMDFIDQQRRPGQEDSGQLLLSDHRYRQGEHRQQGGKGLRSLEQRGQVEG